ncbi:MAG: KH domain-containing protein [Clostridia bacterium]|nr:KH domain-containing protein [Clostridia bacterium]
MENILRLIIENLVDNKEAISINSSEDGNHVKYEVSVAKEEMGRVIGRQGKIAHSIRTLMKSVASRENKKVDIEFVEED